MRLYDVPQGRTKEEDREKEEQKAKRRVDLEEGRRKEITTCKKSQRQTIRSLIFPLLLFFPLFSSLLFFLSLCCSAGCRLGTAKQRGDRQGAHSTTERQRERGRNKQRGRGGEAHWADRQYIHADRVRGEGEVTKALVIAFLPFPQGIALPGLSCCCAARWAFLMTRRRVLLSLLALLSLFHLLLLLRVAEPDPPGE